MDSKRIYLGFSALVVLALVLTGWQFIQRPYTFRGSLIDPPVKIIKHSVSTMNSLSELLLIMSLSCIISSLLF